jgi:hypothetical protein
MQQIADWLEKLGLGQYAQRFAENGIDIAAVPHLTDQDLRKSACCSGIGRPLDKLCQKLTAADIACDVMRNVFGPR